MRELQDCSVDSIVTDCPYGIAFMGSKWDSFGQRCGDATVDERRQIAEDYAEAHAGAPRYGNSRCDTRNSRMEMLNFQAAMTPIFAEALRVAKPGAYMCCFGSPRTYHRLTCAIEDAGWSVVDCVMFVHGQGFPKGVNISKAIDKRLGAERTEVIGTRHRNVKPFDDSNGWNDNSTTGDHQYTAPASAEAKEWDGFNSALKPAHEPIVIATKPLDGNIEKTIKHLKQMEEKLCSLNANDVAKCSEHTQIKSRGVMGVSAQENVLTQQGDAKGKIITVGKEECIDSKADISPLGQRLAPIALSTILSWRHTLEDAYALVNKSTTSMESSMTIDLKTWSCFLLQTTLEDIADLVTHQSKLNVHVLLAESYFSAINAKLDSIRILTVAGPVINQNEISQNISPIVIAQKPVEKTIIDNVLKHGTGAFNVDACRVPTEDHIFTHGDGAEVKRYVYDGNYKLQKPVQHDSQKLGRYPANLVHDGSPEVLALFPNTCKSRGGGGVKRVGTHVYDGGYKGKHYDAVGFMDSGSAARFFYCAKPSRRERGEGNNHPTLKAVALMRWLVRLVTRRGGLVLDPFMGSGTTGIAALQEGMRFVGIERDAGYMEIAKRRIMEAAAEIEKAREKERHELIQQELPL